MDEKFETTGKDISKSRQKENQSQRKKEEDLMGKSSGDTNLTSGSNNHLKDLERDTHADTQNR